MAGEDLAEGEPVALARFQRGDPLLALRAWDGTHRATKQIVGGYIARKEILPDMFGGRDFGAEGFQPHRSGTHRRYHAGTFRESVHRCESVVVGPGQAQARCAVVQVLEEA